MEHKPNNTPDSKLDIKVSPQPIPETQSEIKHQ